jgi:hypothetical protein
LQRKRQERRNEIRDNRRLAAGEPLAADAPQRAVARHEVDWRILRKSEIEVSGRRAGRRLLLARAETPGKINAIAKAHSDRRASPANERLVANRHDPHAAQLKIMPRREATPGASTAR